MGLVDHIGYHLLLIVHFKIGIERENTSTRGMTEVY